jgi:hypothetical protein
VMSGLAQDGGGGGGACAVLPPVSTGPARFREPQQGKAGRRASGDGCDGDELDGEVFRIP